MRKMSIHPLNFQPPAKTLLELLYQPIYSLKYYTYLSNQYFNQSNVKTLTEWACEMHLFFVKTNSIKHRKHRKKREERPLPAEKREERPQPLKSLSPLSRHPCTGGAMVVPPHRSVPSTWYFFFFFPFIRSHAVHEIANLQMAG